MTHRLTWNTAKHFVHKEQTYYGSKKKKKYKKRNSRKSNAGERKEKVRLEKNVIVAKCLDLDFVLTLIFP